MLIFFAAVGIIFTVCLAFFALAALFQLISPYLCDLFVTPLVSLNKKSTPLFMADKNSTYYKKHIVNRIGFDIFDPRRTPARSRVGIWLVWIKEGQEVDINDGRD